MLVDLVRVCEYVLLPYTCGITTGLSIGYKLLILILLQIAKIILFCVKEYRKLFYCLMCVIFSEYSISFQSSISVFMLL